MNVYATEIMSDFGNIPNSVSGISQSAYAIEPVYGRPAPNRVTLDEKVGAIQEIAALSALQMDWDGYGGLPVSPETRRNAELAIARLPPGLPMPEISPNPNGTISFDWETVYGAACLEVGKSRFSFYIKRPVGGAVLADGRADATLGIGEAVNYSLYPPPPASSLPMMVIAIDRFRYTADGRGW